MSERVPFVLGDDDWLGNTNGRRMITIRDPSDKRLIGAVIVEDRDGIAFVQVERYRNDLEYRVKLPPLVTVQ